MRPGVFAKLGDSNLASYYAVYGLGCRKPEYGSHSRLARVVSRYRVKRLPAGFPIPAGLPAPGECRPSNSFSRYSTATRSGTFSSMLTAESSVYADGLWFWQTDPSCGRNRTVISCEIEATRPRYSFVSIGTNDLAFDLPSNQKAVKRFTAIFDEIRRLGSIPVAVTLPPILNDGVVGESWASVIELNKAIIESARKNRVPLMNLWRTLANRRMVNFGMRTDDALHLDTYGGLADGPAALSRSVDFSPKALRYGNNRRNLLLLQTLDRLDREAAELGYP